MSCPYCRKSIEGLPKRDHPLNTSIENTYMCGVTSRQVYQCTWCQEYWLQTTITTTWLGGKLSQSTKPVGYDIDAINEQEETSP